MTDEPFGSFSRRHGYDHRDDPIAIREGAPYELRDAVATIALNAGMGTSALHDIVCGVLRIRPRPQNLGILEVDLLLERCEWNQVYDVIQAISRRLGERYPAQATEFEERMNEAFFEGGIGWQIEGGVISARGEEAFEAAVALATAAAQEADLPTARQEIHEALRDLSRRPDPDLTGAIHHAMGAAECVAREVTGESKLTLGEVLKRYPDLLPRPLDEAVAKTWGYASQTGRHIREGGSPERDEVELAVVLAAAVVTYLAKKIVVAP